MTVAIGFTFPAGRYHATPWDTHVNEADLEWPPSAWRVLRALIAVWHRKAVHEEYPEEALDHLVGALASRPPIYRLPRLVRAHTRHYMPERSGRGERRVLIFDAFGQIDREDELVMVWPDLELDQQSRALMARLLEALGYLGRAESWVEARILDGWDGECSCRPLAEDGEREHESTTIETDTDAVRLPVPVAPEAYSRWRDEKVAELGLDAKRLNAGQRRLLATLPPNLIGALRLESADVRKEGWSRWPGLRYVDYRRPTAMMEPTTCKGRTRSHSTRSATTARLIIARSRGREGGGRAPLPCLEDAVRIGERVRQSAIRKAADAAPGDEVPSVLSGHGLGAEPDHEHAFYLPADHDDDGRIDHVLIHADAGLDRQSLAALDRIRRIWQSHGTEWRVALDTFGPVDSFEGHPYIGPSSIWVSATPYLHPWYRKKRFQPEDQLLRECGLRELPTPAVERMNAVSVRGRALRPSHFHRFRSKPGVRQPDAQGSLWLLTFPEPVRGPLAFGFGCHYGLGIFRVPEGDHG